MSTPHVFSQYVKILGRGKSSQRSMTQQEAFDAMTLILCDKVEPEQIGAFLMLLRVKEETAEELAGFAQALRAQVNPMGLSIEFDWPSYAGKKKHTHWYLLAAKLLAHNGYKVLLHGSNPTEDSRTYCEALCADLNIKQSDSLVTAEEQLTEHNITYMPLTGIHPVLQRLMDLRHLFGLRSPIHSLMRIANPFAATTSMQGVFHPRYAPRHQSSNLLLNNHNTATFKGEGGESEIRPDAHTKIHAVRAGKPIDCVWQKNVNDELIDTVGARDDQLAAVWSGDLKNHYGEQAVINTTALALWAHHSDLNPELAISRASQLWQSRCAH